MSNPKQRIADVLKDHNASLYQKVKKHVDSLKVKVSMEDFIKISYPQADVDNINVTANYFETGLANKTLMGRKRAKKYFGKANRK